MNFVLRMLAAGALCLATGTAMADALSDGASGALGVTPAQLAECFRQASPSVQLERPSSRLVEASKRALLGCLKKANPDITPEQLETVLQKRSREEAQDNGSGAS